MDLQWRTSCESVVGVKVTFVSALPGEDWEHTGDYLSTVEKKNDLRKLMWLKGKTVKTMTGSQSQIYIMCVCVCGCVRV